MAIQILPQQQDLGSALGTGLGQALQGLAQNKLQQVSQRNLLSALVSGGINPQHATILSQLSPQERTAFFQRLGGQDYSTAGQEQQDLSGSLQQLAMEQEADQEHVPQAQPQLPALSGQEAVMRALQEHQQKQAPKKTQQALPSAAQPQQAKKAPGFAEILARPSPEQQLKIAALEQQRQFHKEKLSAKKQEEINKETKPYYDEIAKGAKAAKEGNIRLDRMEALIRKGGLESPGLTSILDTLNRGVEKLGISIDLRAAENPDTQEFRKLTTDFVKNAKDYFGSRLTDTDLRTFLQTVPNVAQSDQGKLRVIQNLKSFNDIALLRKQAADKIIRENGGERPSNFDELVDDTIAPQVQAIANRFKNNTVEMEDSATQRAGKLPVIGHIARLLGADV